MTTEEEKMVLSHDPVPGYPKIFAIAIAIGVMHLAFIFLRSIF